MQLPESIARILTALEDAGFAAYLVGGCVRDDLMGIEPNDYDLCTTARPEQTIAALRAYPHREDGIRHGTVTVQAGEWELEITTFRSEGDYADSRHPQWVRFEDSIERDLARRDFTANAIAWSPTRGYADPFGGREDLKAGVLRTVGDPEIRFREDALRILRGMRFAARFGFAVEEATLSTMNRLADLTDRLSAERICEELDGFLICASSDDLHRFAPVLCRIIPELAPTVDFDQHSPHHAYDLFTHISHVCAAVPGDLTLRWAALLHDIGKVPAFTTDAAGRGHFTGHAECGAALADGILRRLRAPNALRADVIWLIENHMLRLTPDRKSLRRSLSAHGPERLQRLLSLQEADMISKGTDEHAGSSRFAELRDALSSLMAEEGRITLRSLDVTGSDLIALGLQGREVGELQRRLLEAVLDGAVPNEKTALLAFAVS